MIETISELIIEGKFKDDFINWLNSYKSISFEIFKTLNYLHQNEIIHKFLNNESYETPFKFTYFNNSETNKLIEEYNNYYIE